MLSVKCAAAIHNWVRQDQIGQGERPGIATPESIELAKAKNGSSQLEEEAKILKIAAKLLASQQSRVLPIQAPAALANANASAVAHRADPRGPFGVPTDLRLPSGAR